jgi:hypothetical protein
MTHPYYDASENYNGLIFETPYIEQFTAVLTDRVSKLLGAGCERTEPVASDWNQGPSEAGRWAEANPDTFAVPREPNRPICVLAPVGHGGRSASAMRAEEAIEHATQLLRTAQQQENERRQREHLPTSTRGDTWIRVGFRIHRSSPESRRLVLSLCEVYFGK